MLLRKLHLFRKSDSFAHSQIEAMAQVGGYVALQVPQNCDIITYFANFSWHFLCLTCFFESLMATIERSKHNALNSTDSCHAGQRHIFPLIVVISIAKASTIHTTPPCSSDLFF